MIAVYRRELSAIVVDEEVVGMGLTLFDIP